MDEHIQPATPASDQGTPAVPQTPDTADPVTPLTENSNTPSPAQRTLLPDWGDVPPPVRQDQPVASGGGASQPIESFDSTSSPTQPENEVNVPAGLPPEPTDQAMAPRLEQIQAAWSPQEVESWIYDQYLGPLAEIDGLSEEKLCLYLDWLIQRLKTVKHKTKTLNQYQAIWKSIALAKRDAKAQQQVGPANQHAAEVLPKRFSTRTLTLPGANDPTFLDPATGARLPTAPALHEFQSEGMYDNHNSELLSNFVLRLDSEVEIRDDFQPRKVFHGKLRLFGKEFPFQIDADDYADNQKLKAAISEAAGSRAIIHCPMERFREAVSTLNWQPGQHEPRRRVITPDFGWNAQGNEFLVPSGRITADGFVAVDAETELRVDLSSEEPARHLDLAPLPSSGDLMKVKRHVVEELLHVQDRRVTYPLLAAVGVALLARFADVSSLFALWLVGLTGAGKSFTAKLFMNFFGDFPVGSGKFAAWTSTANYLQRAGYFFKDACYLIDDYKPEVSGKHGEVLRVLQNYSDRQGRGRLKSDATTNTTRPIRGLLISTGEDVPEHSASSIARSILIQLPQQPKDLERGRRCMECSRDYRAVTADFIQQVIAQGRGPKFAKTVQAMKNFYYRDIAGEQNDSRIAGNFALLGAGFVEMARYFADVWPDWKGAVRQFLTQDLVAIRDEMVGATKEQQISEVFWSVLGALLDYGTVMLDDGSYQREKHAPVIGRKVIPQANKPNPAYTDLYFISTDLALAEVNKNLRSQGRPELKVTTANLLGQLRREGRLFNLEGQVLRDHGTDRAATKQVRVEGRSRRSFITRKALLTSSSSSGSDGWGKRGAE